MSTTVDLGKITASVSVGTTTTGAAGTNASVSNSGTTQDAVLNFTIPRGAQGVQGPQGSTGPQGPVGPEGPQGPMGDVAVITPEQQAAFTMYSTTGQNTDGPMTQKAVTDALVAGSISYDNSASGLASNNVQGALDEIENKFITTELYVSKLSQAIPSKKDKYLSTSLGLVAGQTYRVVIELSTTATSSMAFYLRSVATSGKPRVTLADVARGDKTIEVSYTPSTSTNYQYLAWYSNESTSNSFDIYFYIDEEIENVAPAFTAEGTSYDNNNSKLSATNVQGALDEIENKFITTELYVSKLSQAIPSKRDQYLSTSLGLVAGQTYRVVIELSTTATSSMAFYLRSVATSGTPRVTLADVARGDKTIEVSYTPSTSTNYQYLAWYSNESISNSFDIYFYIDEEIENVAPAFTAEGTSYDNSSSVLSATNVQDAIGEIEEEQYVETLIFDGSISSIALNSDSHAITTPVGFQVGKKYKITITISSSVSSIVYPYLRSVASNSTPSILFDGVSAPDLRILAGETSRTCYYTPSSETNYQFFNRWADVSTIVTTNWKVYEVSGWKERCDIIDSVGNDIFDISSENIGYTNSSNLIAEKTESGYNFSCVSMQNYRYAFGSLSGLIVGNQYQLTFDYSYDLKVTTQYAGLLRLVKDSPLSSTINQYKEWILKDYISPGSITYRFTAEGNSAFFRVTANDIGSGGSITLSNITLENLGKVADIAEMVVKDMVDLDTEMSNASVSGTYYGRKIPSVNASYKFGYSQYMSSGGNSSGRQGCAAYNGYLFEFGANNAYVNIYNLATKAFHSTVTPTNISTGHCNTACFSTKFYDANDTFPLLYVSGDSNAKIQVYRVTLENDVFTITQVQDITMSLTLPAGSMTWGQAFLDNGKNKLWWFGATGWSSFTIPSIFDGDNNVISAVTLTSSDIKDSFGSAMPGTHLQGGIIVDGILYEVQGVPAWGDTATLNVVDMRGMEDINFINLSSLGWTYEPEGVALYDKHLYVNTQGNGIYILYIGK